MQIIGNPRWQWAASSLGALVAAAIAGSAPLRAMVMTRWPMVLGCTVLGLAGLAGALGSDGTRARLAPVVATLRMTVVFVACAVWIGTASYSWAALAVLVAWRDARAGMSPTRPLLPVALALVVAMAWSAYRPGPAGARVMIAAALAGLAAAFATNRLRDR